jgi:hypothetical protein
MVIKTSMRVKAICRCALDIDSFRCTLSSYHNEHELIQLLSYILRSTIPQSAYYIYNRIPVGYELVER